MAFDPVFRRLLPLPSRLRRTSLGFCDDARVHTLTMLPWLRLPCAKLYLSWRPPLLPLTNVQACPLTTKSATGSSMGTRLVPSLRSGSAPRSLFFSLCRSVFTPNIWVSSLDQVLLHTDRLKARKKFHVACARIRASWQSLVLRLVSFKIYTLSVLAFVGSVCEPDKETVTAENSSLQRPFSSSVSRTPTGYVAARKYLRPQN